MNLTLDYLRSNRKWLIPNVAVWGNSSAFEMPLAMMEQAANKRLIFSLALLGGQDQAVNFADLVDSRGNHLPQAIANPVVMVIPRSNALCYLVGRPSNYGFKIACDEAGQQPVVDLLIMEIDLP